jgi:hypothetical protein
MAFDKKLIKTLLTVLLPINGFLHALSWIVLFFDFFLEYQSGFYYGIFAVSFTLAIFYVQSTFFLHYEHFILEILVVLVFSQLYSLFYVIPLGFVSNSYSYETHGILLTILFVFQIVNQSIILGFLISHIAYFLNVDDNVANKDILQNQLNVGLQINKDITNNKVEYEAQKDSIEETKKEEYIENL